MSRHYRVLLIPSPDQGGYIAHVPVLPGCVTHGGTLDATVDNARAAIRSYIAKLEAEGKPVPEEHPATVVVTVTI